MHIFNVSQIKYWQYKKYNSQWISNRLFRRISVQDFRLEEPLASVTSLWRFLFMFTHRMSPKNFYSEAEQAKLFLLLKFSRRGKGLSLGPPQFRLSVFQIKWTTAYSQDITLCAESRRGILIVAVSSRFTLSSQVILIVALSLAFWYTYVHIFCYENF
jgi:hypothetical protein